MIKKKSHKENPNLFIEGIVLGVLHLTPGCVNATTWAVGLEGQAKLFITTREHVVLDVDDLNALRDVLHNYCHVVRILVGRTIAIIFEKEMDENATAVKLLPWSTEEEKKGD